MRLIFGLVLVLGLGLAGFAVYMAKSYIQNYQAQLEQERNARPVVIETVDIYVTNKALQYGERITTEDVRQVAFPVSALPEGVYRTVEELFPKGDEEPRTCLLYTSD